MANKNNDLPRWDLTNVYPSLDSKEFSDARVEFVGLLDDLDKYIEENNIDPNNKPAESDTAKLAEIINGFIDRINEAFKLGFTIQAYIYSFNATDTTNDKANKVQSELEQDLVRLDQQTNVTFQGWVGQISDKIPEIIKMDGAVSAHAFYLEETAEQSKYMMSAAEENLASELSLSGANAWNKLQTTITSQLTWKIENEDGEVEEWPVTKIIYLRSHPNGEMRKRGYEAEMEAWKSVENQLAACMNGVKGTQSLLNKRRGREDDVHGSIDSSRIDRGTLDVMLEAMKDSFPMWRKYFKAKAKKLGKENLPWWDVFAPMGNTEKTYSYGEACELVVDNFGKFSPELAAYATKAIQNNWIDVGSREGKVAGAFCMEVPGVEESRVLLNYDDSLDSVSTLAHELGHGFHNECLIGKTMLQKNIPMTLAETASIMCQAIITDAALDEAKTPDEELSILENELGDASQVVVDIYSRYLFETEVFERRAKSELSATDLKEIMENAQREAYGDGLDENYLQPYIWTWKPHYYIPGLSFYNYPYTFGLLFATGLYMIYRERGDEFVPQYTELLASAGLGSAADLAARFDIDIRDKQFWAGSLKYFEEKVERYLEL